MKLNSAANILTWLEAILLDIVKGIKGTFHYWDRKTEEIEALGK